MKFCKRLSDVRIYLWKLHLKYCYKVGGFNGNLTEKEETDLRDSSFSGRSTAVINEDKTEHGDDLVRIGRRIII